jgi:hypothetical protein
MDGRQPLPRRTPRLILCSWGQALVHRRRLAALDRKRPAARLGDSTWSLLKRSLANLVKRTLSQLTALVKTWLTRLQPGLLTAFLARTRLDLTPFCNSRN